MTAKYRRLYTAAQALNQRASRQNWRKLNAVGVSLAASALTISVSYNQPHIVTPMDAPNNLQVATSDSVLAKVEKETLVQSISGLLEWLTQGLQTLLRCGMLWLHFLPPIVSSPMLVLQTECIYDWWWSLFRHSICNAGPTFIKFAQWAAMRPDLFQNRICYELSKLQAGAKAHSWQQTEAVLRSVLGEDWQKHLLLKPTDLLGSGCAAQVYRGALIQATQDGHDNRATSSSTRRKEVAIKILHPGIRELMQLDLNLMRSVAYSLECVGGFILSFYRPAGAAGSQSGEHEQALSALEMYPLRCVSLSESVQEFAAFMQSQLDLTQEARALDRLRHNFSGSKWKDRIIVPESVYLLDDFTTSDGGKNTHTGTKKVIIPNRDVLMESFHEGVSMIDIMRGGSAQDSAQSVHNKELAALGLDAILKMLFEDNFVHADLHAGNIIVRYAPHGPPALVLLDAGLTVELRPFDRQNFVSLFRAVIDNDGGEVARLMMEYSPNRVVRKAVSTVPTARGSTSGAPVPAVPLEAVTWENTVIRPEEYKAEMAALVDYVHAQGLSLGKVSVSELLRKVLTLSYEHNVKLESRFVTVVVAIMLAEGMGRRLDPEVDIIARAKPFVRSAALAMIVGSK